MSTMNQGTSKHEVHADDLGDFINALLHAGHHRISISIDTTSAKAFNTGLADVEVIKLEEKYDRMPAAAGEAGIQAVSL